MSPRLGPESRAGALVFFRIEPGSGPKSFGVPAVCVVYIGRTMTTPATTPETPRLLSRFERMLEEAEKEAADFGQQRAELVAQRDEEIAAVRSKYAGEIEALDMELKLIERVKRAINPEPRKPYTPQQQVGPKNRWMGSPAQRLRILRAIQNGAETNKEIGEAAELSNASITNYLLLLREEQLVRLAGRNDARANMYKLTPDGEEYLSSGGTAADEQPELTEPEEKVEAGLAVLLTPGDEIPRDQQPKAKRAKAKETKEKVAVNG